MRIFKNAAVILLALCLLSGLSGCCGNKTGTEWKEELLGGWNNFMQDFSRYALTSDGDLQGKKLPGRDGYTGTYEAAYESWSGTEYLFGGTALERSAGDKLSVSYTLQIASGTAAIRWIERGQEHVLADADAESASEISLNAGDNYFLLKGEDFTGSLHMDIK